MAIPTIQPTQQQAHAFVKDYLHNLSVQGIVSLLCEMDLEVGCCDFTGQLMAALIKNETVPEEQEAILEAFKKNYKEIGLPQEQEQERILTAKQITDDLVHIMLTVNGTPWNATVRDINEAEKVANQINLSLRWME